MNDELRAPTQFEKDREIFRESCRSVEAELDCELTVTHGQIPGALSGTLYRNGPGRFAVGADTYSHPFDGDGHVSRFEFAAGKVRYRNAYVKTKEFVEEQKAGRRLYRGFGSNLPGGILKNAFRTHFKNAANTNVIRHAGRLLALWEGGWPHELESDSLQTIGRFSFGDKLKNESSFLGRLTNPELQFSAHPKIDPRTGDLYNFGLNFGAQNRLMLYKVGADGQMETPRFLVLKDLSFIHDFLITSESKAIFFCTPVHFDIFSMLTGIQTPAAGMTGDRAASVQILVVDLDGPPGEIAPSSIQIFEAPNCFVFHHVNAFERDGQIEIFCVEMDSFPAADTTTRALKGEDFEYPMTRLARFVLTPGRREAQKTVLPIEALEFPRIEESETGLFFTSFFAAGVGNRKRFPTMDQIQKISTHGQLTHVFNYENGLVGEPVVVRTAEGGYVLSLCYNHLLKTSELVILSGETLNLIAVAQLPHSQPGGFHGNWSPA